jgi:predicted Zn-dependent protease
MKEARTPMMTSSHKSLSQRVGIALGAAALVATGLSQAEAATPLPSSAQSGVSLYNKGQVAQSLNVFRSAAKKYPSNAAVYTWMGKAYKKQGGAANQAEAMKAFETALSLNPNEADAMKELAEMYSWYSNKREQATSLLTRYTAANPGDVAAKKQLAMLQIWQGNYTQAEPLVNAVKGKYMSDKNFLAAYAQYLTFTGSPDEAVSIYENYLNAQSSSAVLNLRQGYVAALVKSGDYQKAKGIYGSLLSNAQSSGAMDADVMNAISGMAFEVGDYNESLKLDARLMQNPKADVGAVAMRMARTYQKMGDYNKAMAMFSEMYSQGRLSASEKVEYADAMTEALKNGSTVVTPSRIEGIYREAIQESGDKVGLSLRLARFYSAQPDQFESAVNFYLYAAERDATGEARQELVDYLKSSANNPNANLAEGFSKALQSFPSDPAILAAYAESLSWNEATRVQALEEYLKLAQASPATANAYSEKVEQTLVWHEAKRSHLGLYEALGKAYPTINAHKLAMARAYWKDKSSTPNVSQAYNMYNSLYATYGDDPQFVAEFASLLSQVDDRKMKARGVQLVKELYERNPNDAEAMLAYANQLSYTGKGREAIGLFDKVLASSPNSRDAMVGKANAYLWTGAPHSAAEVLKDARAQYPNDLEIMKSLADAYKSMGRYDKALQTIKEAKQTARSGGVPVSAAPQTQGFAQIVWDEPAAESGSHGHDEHGDEHGDHHKLNALPNANASVACSKSKHEGGDDEHEGEHGSSHAVPQRTVSFGEVASVSGADDFDSTLNALKGLQQESRQKLDHLQTKVNVLTDLAPGQAEVSGVHGTEARPASNAILGGGQDAEIGFGQRVIADEDPAVGNQVGARGDLQYLDELANINQDLDYAMRPTFRTGFLYTTQDGDKTTNKFKHWAIPNQVSFQLTPNTRVRGGYALRKMWIPNPNVAGFDPRSTMAHQYSVGTTVNLTDRLLFDGDVSLETYTQSDSTNFLYQARMQYQANDWLKLQVGSRRSPIETSLLSYAGIQPNNGALAGQLVGQVRETTVFGEVNMGPWKNWDLNLGYDFGYIDGENIANNTKHQAFGNLGYNWQYAENHAVRVAYESMFMGFAKNATLGYYNQLGSGAPQVVATMSPVVAAPPGYVLGGYFSPDTFFLNDIRADFRGNFFDNFLEYKVGGSIGVQNFNPGVPGGQSVTGAAYSANGQLTANLTDAISLYGAVDYLDTAGIFSRWRFGGGLIYRPAIRAMMPVIGEKVDEI